MASRAANAQPKMLVENATKFYATKSGSVTTVMSGRFTITGGSGSPLPQITSAQAEGKRLFVSGQNFQMGAVVTVNGDPQKTVNQDDFSHQLFCKKAAKFIPFDTPVSLAVVNPDGTTREMWNGIVEFDARANSEQRDAALALNLGCFARLGGCKDIIDLLPTIWAHTGSEQISSRWVGLAQELEESHGFVSPGDF